MFESRSVYCVVFCFFLFSGEGTPYSSQCLSPPGFMNRFPEMCEKFEKILMGILRWTCISPRLSGGLAILFVAKCYRNWDKFPQKYIAHKVYKAYLP